MNATGRWAALLVLASGLPSAAQPVSDRMLCEWIPDCAIDGNCTDVLDNPVLSLERVGDTWLWDPLGEWNGFPVGVVETLPQAEALAGDDTMDLGLIFVPMGRTDGGALILDGYGFSYFPQRGLTNRAMRHHCTPVAEGTS